MVAGERERSLEQAYVDWAYERLDAMVAQAAAPLPDVFADIGGQRSSEQNQKGRLKMLSAARDHDRGLVTGRLDEVDGDTFYIGRCHVDGENGEPAVVDWRADVGERFNQANHTDPKGIGRRRSFLMRRRVVEAVDDDILVPGFRPPAPQLEVAAPPEGISVPEPARPAEPVFETVGGGSDPSGPGGGDVDSDAEGDVAVDGAMTADAASADLRARDLLLAELEVSRSGEMHDVVATIQGDQDRLIRADPAVPLLIQGGPGTGKTVVGLHRAAWVLYEQRRQVGSESVLVVGPNARFLDYIRNVLPSLGESSARQTTLDELAVTALPPAQREQIEIRAAEGETAARIKAGQAMVRLVANAIRLQARPKPLSVSHGLYNVELSEHDVAAVVDQLFANRRNYRAVQAQLVSALSARFVDLFHERAVARQGRAPLERERAAFMEAATQALAGERQAILPNLEAPRVVNRLFTEPDLLRAASSGVLEPEVLGALTRPRGGPARWTSSDLPLLDEAQHLISGEATSYSHLVVDEAQDLSPMQWRMVLRRAQRASLTILGDIAQGTAAWAPTRWEQVLQACGLADRAAVGALTLGYRIPAPVSEFACRLLPEIAPGVEAPTSFREGEEPLIERFDGSVVRAAARIGAASSEDPGLLAVIAPSRLVPGLRRALGEGGPVVLEAHEAKGLEFDRVVVVEPAEIAGTTQRGLRSLFVALTRPTKHLVVLTSTELPGALRDASPAGVQPLDPFAHRVCACGLEVAPSWRHCPVCGAAVVGGAGREAVFTESAGQIVCVAHGDPACRVCSPPEGFEQSAHGWRPRLVDRRPGTPPRAAGAPITGTNHNDDGRPLIVGESAGDLPADVYRILALAPPESPVRFVEAYLRRCMSELDLTPSGPLTGDRPYVNLVPPPRFGRKRAAAVLPSSGRVEIYVTPDSADRFPTAREVKNNGEAFAVQVYLESEEAVGDAVALTRIGLEQR